MMPFCKSIAAACLAAALLLTAIPVTAGAQTFVSNTSEEKVPPYTLPDPLAGKDGQKITNADRWNRLQQPWIYQLFENV